MWATFLVFAFFFWIRRHGPSGQAALNQGGRGRPAVPRPSPAPLNSSQENSIFHTLGSAGTDCVFVWFVCPVRQFVFVIIIIIIIHTCPPSAWPPSAWPPSAGWVCGFAGWVCGFAGLRVLRVANCELPLRVWPF